MTTLSISQEVKMPLTYKTYDDLVNFVLDDISILEIEAINGEEKNFIEGLDSYKGFKNIANKIGI